MLLAIDVGNTNTVFALFEGETIVGQWRITTSDQRTADEYAVALLQLMQMRGLTAKSVQAAILSSVVPSVVFPLVRCLRDHFGVETMLVGAPNITIGMNIKLERPAEAGADRLVNAVAARARYGNSLMVLDFGTATTFDMVDSKGDYIGGVIAPGVNLSMDALHAAAAKLPRVAVARPERVIGNSTVSAMQSGLYYGYIGMIEGIITRAQAELGYKTTVIATGGLAPLFARATPMIQHLDADLTLRGLLLVYQLNQKETHHG